MCIDGVIQGWQKYSAVLYTEDRELFEWVVHRIHEIIFGFYLCDAPMKS